MVVSEIAKRNSKSTVDSGFSVTRNILAGAVVLGLTAGVCAPVWAAADINSGNSYHLGDTIIVPTANGNNITFTINGQAWDTVLHSLTVNGKTIVDTNGNLAIDTSTINIDHIGDYKVLADQYTNKTILTVGNNIASGQYAKSLGSGTTAQGDFSTALGYQSKAIGKNASAKGQQTIAVGPGATTWGYHTVVGKISDDYDFNNPDLSKITDDLGVDDEDKKISLP